MEEDLLFLDQQQQMMEGRGVEYSDESEDTDDDDMRNRQSKKYENKNLVSTFPIFHFITIFSLVPIPRVLATVVWLAVTAVV